MEKEVGGRREWAVDFLRLCVVLERDDLPKDLTAGISEPAQMSEEAVLAGGNGEAG